MVDTAPQSPPPGGAPHGPGLVPGNPRELLTEAADQLAELSRSVVTHAVERVVEPIADEGYKLAGEGIKLATEGVKLATDGVKLAGEGMKLAGEGAKIAQGMLRRVLRHRREERDRQRARDEKKDPPKDPDDEPDTKPMDDGKKD